MRQFTIQPEEQWYKLCGEKENVYRNLIGTRKRGRIMNNGFFVNDNNEIRLVGVFINRPTTAYYNSDYSSGSSWQRPNSIENLIWTLKNDVDPFPSRIQNVSKQLIDILKHDLIKISEIENKNFTVCVVPRSKKESNYRQDQLLFREIISEVVNELRNFENGTKYIIRHTNTVTTHLEKNGGGGEGNLPYPGITKDTCTISENIKNRDILLIDDLYTKTVNIDEDAIQALYDKGARSIVFYSIGKTLQKKINTYEIYEI